jgi:hypothetical protein
MVAECSATAEEHSLVIKEPSSLTEEHSKMIAEHSLTVAEHSAGTAETHKMRKERKGRIKKEALFLAKPKKALDEL